LLSLPEHPGNDDVGRDDFCSMTDLPAGNAVERLQATLGGGYTIERELGGGGMSRVFLAHETSLNRAVVLKMLSPELAAGVSAERFAREVKLAARLQQANIVPLLSTGEASGIPWYSMPYVRGESLRARLASGHAIPLTEATHILRDVARALAFAHGEGVVHRDIKPDNILLSGGAAVVTDFGIAKALTVSRTEDGSGAITMTQSGASIGTPAYMAPEQAAGDPATDHRADIYAWGIVAWELIAGKHPFAGRGTPTAMIAAHLSETPTVLAEAPPTLATLVARCLEKDPARRPQSASELLSALDQVGSASGEQPTTDEQTASPFTVAIIAAVVLIVAAAVWLAPFRSRSADALGDKSLAVIPFESVGGDTANAYFAEGIADELTTALTKVPGLRLAATSSASSYRNKTASVQDIGKALSVATVLQGKVRRQGARMRVSAELSSAGDGKILWSNSYEREVKDVFAVQDEITHDIVSALRVTLTGGTRADGAGARHDTTDADTYDLYLRGLFFLQRRGAGVARSIEYFRRALARDSSFARAWAVLGEAYTVLPLYSPTPVDSVLSLARTAIANAHRLDPSNAEAFAAEGMANLLAAKPAAAASAFERALSLDSSNAWANRAYWGALVQTGRTEESVVQGRRAARVDPLSSTTFMVATQIMLNANRIDEAIVMARRATELDTSVTNPGRLIYGLAMYAAGNIDSARKLVKGAVPSPQGSPWMGYLIGATGNREGAAAYIRQLEAEQGRNSFANMAVAWTYLGLGDTTRALDAMERAAKVREPVLPIPFGMPFYNGVRHSARFAAVIRDFGLDPSIFGATPGAARSPAPR
jgi:serine/threonine-protein kinase